MADKPRKNRRVRTEQEVSETSEVRAEPRDRGTNPASWAKARVQQVRRVATWVLRVAVTAALIVGGVYAGRRVEAHVRRSPSFAIKAIEVHGNERLAPVDVVATAGLAEGENVFETPPELARKKLIAHPWIADATVERRLPDHIALSIREHVAAAVLVLEQLYLVADDGSVFKPLEPGDPTDLPVITGVDPEAFTNDRAARARVLVNAVALLHDYRDAGLWRREPIAEIHVEPGGGLSLYVGEAATYVRLGDRPFRKKLRRFRRVLDSLQSQKAQASYVYLDNTRRPDRVAVRLR